MKHLVNLDMNQNELQNVVIQPLATAPTGVLGQLYYNTTDKCLYQHDGTAWKKVGALYDLSIGAAASNTVPLKLVGNDGTTDTINIKGAGGATLSVSGSTLTITTANTNTTYTFTGTASATGYAIKCTPSSGTATTITIPLATASAAGLLSPSEKALIATITSKAPLASPALTGTPTAPTPTGNTGIANKGYVDTAVANGIAASDAMIFKGTIGTGGTVTALPTTYKTGWTYRVITAGTYAGNVCEIGDLIIALVDRSGSGNVNADWTVAQTNINGALTNVTGTAPIVVSGSGSTRAITHANSGVAVNGYGPADGGNLGWEGYFVVPVFNVDAKGHITYASDSQFKVPNSVATPSKIGLMGKEDKSKLDKLKKTEEVRGLIAAGKLTATIKPTEELGVLVSHRAFYVEENLDVEVIVDVKFNRSSYEITFSIAKAFTSPIAVVAIFAQE